eukprot:CAMPEP_0168182374 /NCGR_PEP_ID=MMETSP0139_2-20121125/11861_1 /TAXON_ID=44445 /ORGANISM="Pseudo-nitzschia australis, Strain 10249 10 AB" /LENGTH=439 /DNA_ID=CAMNT_0008103303 /DNA_START=220 /DNA_END=1539 /DNA_ORIENTATION=-
MANLLAKKLPNLRVALIDSKEVPPSQPLSERVPSPRSYALSPQSLEVLGESVRSRLHIGYYDSMQVWQDSSPATLTFTSSDLDPDSSKVKYLGGCCEDQALVATLYEDIQGSTETFLNTSLASFHIGDSNNLVSVKTKEDSEFKTALLVGADGGNSWVRKTAGISRVGGDYEQSALTFTVSLEKSSSMNGRAFQRYLSDGGPLALLPTYSPNHAVIVWSTSPENVSRWKNASNEDLVRHLNDCLLEGPQRIPPLIEDPQASKFSNQNSIFSNLLYGAERVLDTVHYGLAMASQHPQPSFRLPPKISTIASPKFTFPLSCYNATTFVKERVALIGDAAHTVHPMAGQGLNLGLGDVDVLVSCLKKAHDSGMDLSSFLHEYNSNRHKNVSISLGGIHALQKLFQNQNITLQHVKTLGINTIQNFGPLRQQLAVAAAHGVSL